MEDTVVNNDTVFYPTIKRIKYQNKNNLYELLDILPAKPITPKGDTLENNCDFYPRTDKCYVPKKKSRLKVNTVRDIRKSFEEDTYAYLPSELEKQQSALLKKIRRGSSKDESTKVLARNILKSDIPISRSTWQVLVNLNPEQYLHPKQFIFWNGKHIQVNGSKGGNQKYICHETAASNSQYKNIKAFKNNTSFKKKGLLRNSLSIKFKPGPLGRKKFLDDSHQKYHVGDIELVNLPKPGLDVYPTYGTSLEPTITHFINNLRKEDGTISQKWAEYAVSVLGTFHKSDAVQIVKESVTFDLNYKCDQHRLLMRRDVHTYGVTKALINETVPDLARHEVVVLPEIKDMMSQILDCIEIGLNQDNMYSGVDELKQVNYDEVKEEQAHTKDKLKRKYGELDRLDVTVIRLPEESNININETCNRPFCSLGCVCNSLESSFNLRGHCGLVDCMFGCKCDFSKYTAKDSLDWECELIPDLLNLNHGISSKLAKEEKKFHQTVILTGDRSILLKSHKRNAKAPKKYAEFYRNQNFRNDYHNKQTVSVIALKINCENIEPWCMVHNLYKCFCKGRFIEANEPVGDDTDIKDSTIPKDTIGKNNSTEVVDLTSRMESKSNKFHTEPYVDCTSTCSRVNPYVGRKFNAEYYRDTNEKISNMEKNDTNLRHRMWSIIYKSYSKEKVTNKEKKLNNQKEINKNNLDAQPEDLLGNTSTNLNQFLSGVNEHIKSNPTNDDLVTTRSSSKLLPNKTKLVAWLESNYKLYKERIDKGITKTSLDPPKAGKVALYPWSFVLSRYRERKNFFLISKQKPFRIFMAVNTKNPIFENCININDIRFAELHTYPVTVKNLLTNATDLKDNFCILCGLSDCWELIGSVSKINDGHVNMMGHKETSDTESVDPFNINPTWGDKSSLESKFNDKESFEINVDGPSSDITVEEEKQCVENFAQSAESSISQNHLDIAPSTSEFSHDADTSKWFVMTVEKDFSEIRFYKRGFFVKYEGIVKAINVARMSGKTVRLSSQKCMEKSSGPQFGIYAIPNANEYCVFVGPYEIQDSLGIETIKTILDVGKLKRTRGFWITTNKIDNLKVIDNPLSFMNSVQNSKTVPLDFHSEAIDKTVLGFEEKQSQDSKEAKKTLPSTSKESIKKIVKPIKIRKTNGFYHLDSNGLLKKKISSPDEKTKTEPLRSSDNIDENVMGKLLKISHVRPYKMSPQTTSPIKITTVYSIGKEDKPPKCDRTEKGMFILKPEEINRKLFENKLISTSTTQSEGDLNSSFDEEQDMDSEHSLTDSSMCNASNDNDLDNYVCVISDEEGSCTTYNEEKVSVHRKVWIECINETMGWIHALRNEMDQISFKLPACEYSEFYPEQEAFDKINEELSTRFGLPSADFTWKVVENEDTLSGPEINFSDHILFSKQESRPSNIKTYCRPRRKTAGPALAKTFHAEFNVKTDLPSEQINPEDLPFQSSSANSSKFIHIIRNAPETLKHLMTDTLKSILSMSQDLDEEGQS